MFISNPVSKPKKPIVVLINRMRTDVFTKDKSIIVTPTNDQASIQCLKKSKKWLAWFF